ncbi:MAG: hypothetical protein J0M09_15560 [Xanthomonadales bacterium]|nr:hypothetical protein [Xanthomonadales bacterium]
MADWTTHFETPSFRVQTSCAHPHLQIRVLILGDPQHFIDGVRTEHRTEVRCSNARGFLAFLSGLVADRTGADYRPRGAWEESLTYGDTIGTQILEYRELVEADPEGDYEIAYKGRITEATAPHAVLAEHTTTFKINRSDLVAIANALMQAFRKCCAQELAFRDDPHRPEHRA